MDKNVGKARAGQAEDRKKLPVFVTYGLIAVGVLAAVVIGLVIYLNIAGGYVATVDGMKIGTGEFKYYLGMEKQSMYSTATNADPNLSADTFWKTKIGGENAIDVAKKQALENARIIKIQYIKAKENKTVLTADEIKAIDDQIKKQVIDQLGSGNKIQANNALQKNYGFSIEDLRNAQIEQQTVTKYQYGEMGKIKITDEEIKKDYDADPKSYDKVTVRQILFLYNGSDGKRSKEDSKKLADDTLAKIKAGEDMTALAEKLSEDPGVKDNKGEYTLTKFDSYVTSFKDWAIKANVGDMAVVESTEYGYHVMKAEKREPQAFDAVKDNIKGLILQDRFTKQYTQQLDSWKNDAKYKAKLNNAAYNSITK